jgi:hypothetical protein
VVSTFAVVGVHRRRSWQDHVVLEGIVYADHYGPMLAQLRADHRGPTHGYYLDVLFTEMLAVTPRCRSWTRPASWRNCAPGVGNPICGPTGPDLSAPPAWRSHGCRADNLFKP